METKIFKFGPGPIVVAALVPAPTINAFNGTEFRPVPPLATPSVPVVILFAESIEAGICPAPSNIGIKFAAPTAVNPMGVIVPVPLVAKTEFKFEP